FLVYFCRSSSAFGCGAMSAYSGAAMRAFLGRSSFVPAFSGGFFMSFPFFVGGKFRSRGWLRSSAEELESGKQNRRLDDHRPAEQDRELGENPPAALLRRSAFGFAVVVFLGRLFCRRGLFF